MVRCTASSDKSIFSSWFLCIRSKNWEIQKTNHFWPNVFCGEDCSHFHKLNLHLCFFNGWFWWMFFNSIKEKNRLRKEINRLISKGMPNVYLKVTIEKSWRSQNFDFRNLKDLLPGQFLGSSNSSRYHWNLKLLVATWKSEIWKEN